MSTSSTRSLTGPQTVAAARAGALGGVVGGVAFGVMMQGMGMMPMVAQLVGSDSVAVGWVVHLANSVAFGLLFGGVLGATSLGRRAGLAAWIALGLGYGVLWWVLGALLIMPAWLGMDLLVLNTTTWQSLGGHLVYGALLGAVVGLLVRRTPR